jgi:hypothetical protein
VFEAGLVYRHHPIVEPLDLVRIDVNARNVDAKFGKACPGYKSYITGANHCNMHLTTFLQSKPCGPRAVNSRDPQGQFG